MKPDEIHSGGGQAEVFPVHVVREPVRRAVRPEYGLPVSGGLDSIRALVQDNASLVEGVRVVSEHDVSMMWRELFHTPEVTRETVVQAKALLEKLKPESPLRHRLAVELDEIRDLKGA